MIFQQPALELRRVVLGIEHEPTQCLGRLGPWPASQTDQAVLQVHPRLRGEQLEASAVEVLRDAGQD